MNDEQIGRVGKALGHPVRVAIIRAVRAEPGLHPRGISESRGVPLSDCSYHFTFLEKSSVLRLIREEPRRGSIAHFYAIDKGPMGEATLVALDALDTIGLTRAAAPRVIPTEAIV